MIQKQLEKTTQEHETAKYALREIVSVTKENKDL